MKRLCISFIITLISIAAVAAREKLTFRTDSSFTVLQLTDLHLMPASPLCDSTYATVATVIRTSDPDLVVLTGDIITYEPAREGWDRFISFMESQGKPFVVTMGNHDGEYLPKDDMFSRLMQSPLYVGDKGPEGIGGCGNTAIAINGAEGTPAAVIYCIDSNDYQPRRELGSYDWIHLDQIDWYRNASKQFAGMNGDRPLPALAFFHIPLHEYRDMVDLPGTIGNKYEGAGAAPDLNTGFFAAAIEQGDIMGIFVGHDHDNDYVGLNRGIALGFGRATGAEAYGRLPRGGRVIRLSEGKREFETYIITPFGEELRYYYPTGFSQLDDETLPLLPTKQCSAVGNGVRYDYYEGLMKHTSQIDTCRLVDSGILPWFTIDSHDTDDHFAYRYTTLIDIPETGVYRFYTQSDDGSVLYIDGQKIVDNDGGHSTRRAEGKVKLEKGLHDLRLDYFENYMGQELDVLIESRHLPTQPIPAQLLYLPD